MRDSRPQQTKHCAAARHLPLGGRQKVRSEALPAEIVFRGQSAQAGHRQRERAELHGAPRNMRVSDDPPRAAQQEPIARHVTGVFQCRLKLGRIARTKNLRQKTAECEMLGGRARNDGRSHAALAGVTGRNRTAARQVGGDG